MRILHILAVLIFSCLTLNAQIILEEEPLQFNPVLQKLHQQSEDAHKEKLKRLFGNPTAANSRSVTSYGCLKTGDFEVGDTVYVVSGDSVRICLDTIGFETMTNNSIDGIHGTTAIDSSCIVYYADEGIIYGKGDVMIVTLCLPDNGGCFDFVYPVVVKRAGIAYIEDNTIMTTEDEAMPCVDPTNVDLPGQIVFSRFLDCQDSLLAIPSNGNQEDSCFLLTSFRYAGQDTVCFQIVDQYCVSDTFKFPFNVIGDTLELPFLDDFSYAGPYPGNEWADISVFVNNKWTVQPPSVGFATFDGLDASGTPYGGFHGRADFLTSNYLNLNPSFNDVYLSFYVQPKGLGYHPNLSQGDSMVLEFKNYLGDWELIDVFPAMGDVPIDSIPPWEYKTYPITADDYLYKGFQFRFVNYAARKGIIDIWHIDYVRLNKDEIPDGSFGDVAFTNVPNSILNRYSSMPYRHFVEDGISNLITDIDIELFSQFPDTVLAEPSDLTVTELMNDVIVHYDNTLLEDPLTQRNVPPLEHRHFVNPIEFEPFPSLSGDSLIFETQYTFEISAQNPGLFPQVARNDTVKHKTYMTNFFALDDGSAETAMKIGLATTWGIAVEYEAAIDDTLQAIQVHFPHYNDNEQDGAKFNILVYVGDLNTAAVYNKQFVDPFYADTNLDTLQGYTTYRLTDDFENPSPVFIPAGKFYICLEQATNINKPVRIGLDKNTPEASAYQYIYNGYSWSPLGNKGAAMLRAVVGNYSPGSTPVEEISLKNEAIKIYPNPSSGIFNLAFENSNFDDYQVSVFNAMGQLIFQQKLNAPTIDLSDQNAGIYFLKIDNLETKASINHKVFIFKQ